MFFVSSSYDFPFRKYGRLKMAIILNISLSSSFSHTRASSSHALTDLPHTSYPPADAESTFFFFTITTTLRAYFHEGKVGHAASGNSTAIQLCARCPITSFESLYLANRLRYQLGKRCVL